ncbi:MAG: NifU family protein [Candidatus Heimdallarchaeaceae archaeon]
MKEDVESVIDLIKVALQQDGGDIELVNVHEDTGVVEVRLLGSCAGCPFSQFTLTNYVEKTLKERVPGVTEVINLNLQGLRTA